MGWYADVAGHRPMLSLVFEVTGAYKMERISPIQRTIGNTPLATARIGHPMRRV